MKRLFSYISVFIFINCLIFIVYFDIFLNGHQVFYSSILHSNYSTDDLKLLQPTEKKTYTPCPNNIIHHALAPYNDAIVDQTEINQTKLRWQNFVRTIASYPPDKYFGRGIVSSASSGFHRCQRLIASIKLLRWLKCRLPVEVFMYPGELKAEEIVEFETIPNVTVRVLKYNVTRANGKPVSFVIKPSSILYSSFEHVLWLDSDNIAVRDPEYLFDLPHYTRSTAMFWPDFWSTPGKNAIWKILDLPCRAEDYEQESGQMLINKRLAWKALNLALYLNLDQVISRVLYGDKDTFRLAWKVLGTPFYFIRKFLAQGGFDYVKSVDKDKPNKTIKFCGHTMVQHDPYGEILFLHANSIKSSPPINFPDEKTHHILKKYINPWHIYRRYANSAPYFRPLAFNDDHYSCMTYVTDDGKYLPPLSDDDFHHQVSANTTAKYLSYLNRSIVQSDRKGTIDVVERNWQ